MTARWRDQVAVWQRRAELAEAKLDRIRELVAEQATDEGCWFVAERASEAYLQQELRRLHAEVEEG